MRFKLRKCVYAVILVALVPLFMQVSRVLKYKPQRVIEPKVPVEVRPFPNIGTCDNQKCNPTKKGMLNVHIVPHSHDDVGWKKTMDQYYNGGGGGNSESFYHGGECTRCVLDHTIEELLKNKERRFIFVEMAFLSTWFYEQTEELRKKVVELINQRRLELIIGGWCMSDSATTYYDDVIDQHTHGFQWIMKEFGECAMPKSAWHVDQFGHSREHSSLFAQMGFDGLFLGRIDFQDQDRRTRTQNMETIWRTSPDSLGDGVNLFTSVLYDGYFSPEQFRWEGWGAGMMSQYNSEMYVNNFVRIANERAQAFKTNHLLIPFGGDFAFNTAAGWFDAIDNLIKYTNDKQATGGNVNLLYSTPTCYLNSVNNDSNTVAYETMTTDFFPYATIPNTFWTGFFTSRPGLKRHIKTSSSLLQTCKEMATLSQLPNASKSVDKLKEAVGVLQHHDAITGTEMQHVTDDYNKMLSDGETACKRVISDAYKALFEGVHSLPSMEFCDSLNISMCPITEKENTFVVNVFNPLSFEVTHFLRLPVPGGDYSVRGENREVEAETAPLPESTRWIPERGSSRAKAELVFPVKVPPLGYSVYKVQKESDTNDILPLQNYNRGDVVVGNEYISLVVDAETGLAKTLTNTVTNTQIKFEQTFKYYLSSEGQPRDPNDRTGGFLGSHRRPSGAYAFCPKEGADPIKVNKRGVKIKTFKGINAIEVHQQFNSWISQVIRLYDGVPYVEFEWTVGPIPDDDRQTKEVISNFETNLQTNGVVYTDSNGREMIKRRLNKRETWNLTVTSPISGNYYPVTGRIALKDTFKGIQLTVLTDRCQGGTSLKNGQMELMVHRRTFKDDDMGVQEPLNEKGTDGRGLIIRGKHYIFLGPVESAPLDYRPFGLQVHHPPTVSFFPPKPELPDAFFKRTSFLSSPLPDNVHILTLDQVLGSVNTWLLRLENFFERGEISPQSEVAEVELQNIFNGFTISSVRELSLGANHEAASVHRLQWNTKDGVRTPANIGSEESLYQHMPPFRITLKPMEIRTFHVHIVKETG